MFSHEKLIRKPFLSRTCIRVEGFPFEMLGRRSIFRFLEETEFILQDVFYLPFMILFEVGVGSFLHLMIDPSLGEIR
jgi:hypothetical protein